MLLSLRSAGRALYCHQQDGIESCQIRHCGFRHGTDFRISPSISLVQPSLLEAVMMGGSRIEDQRQPQTGH